MHGVPNILGIFAWGTEYPRKFSIQDAVFPDLEGGSKFPEGIPFFLGKIVRGYRIHHDTGKKSVARSLCIDGSMHYEVYSHMKRKEYRKDNAYEVNYKTAYG